MKIRSFTPQDYPGLVEVHKSLNIVWPERPGTAEAWAEVDRKRDPKKKYQRWVAIEDDRVVGFAYYAQSFEGNQTHRFYVNIEVRPEYQRRGIGAALYDQVMQGLQAHEPRTLRADAFSHLPQGFAFLQKRGFYEAFRETPVHMELAAFDPTRFSGVEAKLNSQGIEFKSLRQLESDPQRDRKLYELYSETDLDVPHEEDISFVKEDFETWVKWGVYDPALMHEAYFVAVEGEAYVGLHDIGRYLNSNTLMGGLLGVRRAYRKRGIGLILQVCAMRYGKENGYARFGTCTAKQNAPMQVLFDRLGYARDPEWQQCQKDLK